MAEPTFIKVNDSLLNPAFISAVWLNYEDYQTDRNNCVAITLSTGDIEIFEKEEAEILRRYFLHGSRTIDLKNLYWVEKP